MKVLTRNDRFVFGMYRRDMKVIGYLGTLRSGLPKSVCTHTACVRSTPFSMARTQLQSNTISPRRYRQPLSGVSYSVV